MRSGTIGVHASFAPIAESVAAARRLVRRAFDEWPVTGIIDDGLLVVSELATNAVIHAGTEFSVSCTHLGHAVRLAVRDSYSGRGLPAEVVHPGAARTSGRGLLLCASLSSSWGVEHDRTGKTVWCLLDLPGAPIDRTPGGLAAITLDTTGRIRDWTGPAEELLGWRAVDRVGTALADLAQPGDIAGLTGLTGLSVAVGTVLLRHRDGHYLSVYVRLLPLGAATPTVALIAPERDGDAFEPPARPRQAGENRRDDVLAALDSDRVPAYELPQRAAEACCDFLGGDAAYLMLVDNDGELRVAGSTGLPDRSFAYIEQTDDVLRATPEHVPQVVTDLAQTPVVPALLAEAGMRSAVSVPVLVDGRLTGQLTVASATPGRFGDDDAVRLHLAAAQLARHLDRARVTDLERRRRGWLSYLAEASDLLAGTLDPQATIAVLSQLLVPRLALWCAVLVPDERGRARLRHVWHADETLLDAVRAVVGQAPSPSLDSTAATPWSGLASVPPSDLAGADRIRTGPAVTLALTARGRALGVVVLGREPGDRFGREGLGLVEEICRRAGLILDNALLYSDHVATSSALQRSLLPARLPVVTQLDVGVAYQAKGEGHDVGGDFYDLYAVAPETWRFTIGDVCGSGPQAAAITGLARNALRILGRQGLPLPEVLAELNALILDESVRSRFLTALHGEIWPDPDGGVRLRMVAAGHPAPYLITSDAPPQPVGRSQPLLGVLPEVSYEPDELWLAPGQVLLCLTDGVLERRDGNRLLGEDGLDLVLARCAGVSAGAAAAMVQQAVLDYSPDPSVDDIAVLVLRANG
ncbi:MAG TPA: SpoIIE family protein phosphatase [Mycobacteriales bacterium]|nr:SpoIIE family protein phosphatase [Mycobacteriales bacterium]